MLEIPTFRQLVVQAEQDLASEDGDRRLLPALEAALAYALAGIAVLWFRLLQYISRQVFLDTADEEWALQHANIYGVELLPAEVATGTILATGDNDTVIDVGTLWQSADGFEYVTTEEATIVSGEAEIPVSAVEAGEDSNLTTTGAQLTLVGDVSGLDATAAVLGDGITGGTDVESAKEVQVRALERLRAPRRGGSAEDYEIWAKEASSEIGGAWATANYQGIGTVLVIVAKKWDPTDPEDSPIPGPSLLAEVAAYIDTKKPAGLWLVSVEGPTLQELDPQIVLDPDSSSIRDAVTKALARHLATVEPGGTVYYDDCVGAINRAAGEGHHLLKLPDELLELGVNNVELEDGELAVPGDIDWTA